MRWAVLDVWEATSMSPHPSPSRNLILSKHDKHDKYYTSWKSMEELCYIFCSGIPRCVPWALSRAVCFQKSGMRAVLVCVLSLHRAVNKEIDDKVVEKRQLDRTARHEWQRARSAFTAENAVPSREPAMPGRCAKACSARGERSCSLYQGFQLDFELVLLKWDFPYLGSAHNFKKTWCPLENKHSFSSDIKAEIFDDNLLSLLKYFIVIWFN